jgi:hypothetical protein
MFSSRLSHYEGGTRLSTRAARFCGPWHCAWLVQRVRAALIERDKENDGCNRYAILLQIH